MIKCSMIMFTKINIFRQSASPPPVIVQSDTGTLLSPGFTFATDALQQCSTLTAPPQPQQISQQTLPVLPNPPQPLSQSTNQSLLSTQPSPSPCLICRIYSITSMVLNSNPITVDDFTGNSGPKVYISSDPLSIFVILFTHNLLHLIVNETNRYAAEVFRSKGLVKHREASEEGLCAYFGFMILMGINKKSEIRDYWNRDPQMLYSPIADRISRDRFEEIIRYLHFVDNLNLPTRGHPSFSRLQKVQPILSHLKKSMSQAYSPHCQLSIDEAMAPFKGRSSMKQYMPVNAGSGKKGILWHPFGRTANQLLCCPYLQILWNIPLS